MSSDRKLIGKELFAIGHARWIREATEATKQAAEIAKSYPGLDCIEFEVPRDERAVAFHEKNSGPDANLHDAIMDALRWHVPPDHLRELETDALRWHVPPDHLRELETLSKVRDLEGQVIALKEELERKNIEAKMWRESFMSTQSARSDDDADGDEDYD